MQHINTYKENNILHSTFFIFILLAFLLEPAGISEGSRFGLTSFHPFHLFYGGVKYISFAIVVCLAFNIKKPSMMFILIGLYEGVILLSSLVNGNLTDGDIFVIAKILSLTIIAEYYMSHVPFRFLKSLACLLSILVALNLVSLMMFPEGIYTDDRGWKQNYFLGFKNLHIYFFLPCFLSVSILEYLKNQKKFYILLLLGIIIVSCLINKSTTSLVVILILSVNVLFFAKYKLPKWLNPNIVFGLAFIFSVVMITMTISGSFSQYSEQLTDTFDKESDTIGVRGLIWTESLIYMLKHPLLGNGCLILDMGWSWDVPQMHNNFLDMAVIGGIVLLFIFFCKVFLLSRRMRNIDSNEIFNFVLFYLIAFSIEFLTEGRRNNYLWFPSLIVIYYVPSIIKRIQTKI